MSRVLLAVIGLSSCAWAAASRELLQIFQEDQCDRAGNLERSHWDGVSARDARRRERVRQILSVGGARVADDFLHAAMVFQHGESVADYHLAHSLALKAVELDPRNKDALWLAAASKDRELMTLGVPQLYGTQFHQEAGRWVLYQVDATVTDEERARWNVPPLGSARERARLMNESP